MTEREIVVYNQTAMYFERDSLETEMNQIEMLNNLRIGPWCVGEMINEHFIYNSRFRAIY